MIFLGETSANTKAARRYGRAFRSEQLVTKIPHGQWKTMTFVAGLLSNGIVAPLVVDGPMNGSLFQAYVEQLLAKCLCPRDIVIKDNLYAHKITGFGKPSKRAELNSFIWRHSPDFNPIELAFSRLKSLLRTAAARTVEQIEKVIKTLIARFNKNECTNYFRHCGYTQW